MKQSRVKPFRPLNWNEFFEFIRTAKNSALCSKVSQKVSHKTKNEVPCFKGLCMYVYVYDFATLEAFGCNSIRFDCNSDVVWCFVHILLYTKLYDFATFEVFLH